MKKILEPEHDDTANVSIRMYEAACNAVDAPNKLVLLQAAVMLTRYCIETSIPEERWGEMIDDLAKEIREKLEEKRAHARVRSSDTAH